ncbi:MAG: GGDEF domain-containing protein [Pirellulaceae bacterium]
MSAPAVILLLSDSEDRLRRWSASLAAAPVQLLHGEQDLSGASPVDVVLTDKALVEGLAGIHPDQLARGEIGVIRVGADGAADVTLPTAATDREVKLSCLLLAQIVRLRRERRESHHIRRALRHLALSDPLTGLPNRRAWDDELSRRIANLAHGGALLLAVMDLDQFKQINDEQGHLTGDEVLRGTARALTAGVRDDDFVARLGGDEFGLLITDCELSQSQTIVDRVRESIRTAARSAETVTSSAGFAVASDADQASRLFATADDALRDAKRAGRNRTVEGHLRPIGPR